MQQVNLDNIFGLFKEGIDKTSLEVTLGEKATDRLLLEGVVRSAETYDLLDAVYRQKYGKDYLQLEDKIKKKYFRILYRYLDLMELTDKKETDEVVERLGYTTVMDVLETLLDHFIQLEEYERCSVIKKVMESCS